MKEIAKQTQETCQEEGREDTPTKGATKEMSRMKKEAEISTKYKDYRKKCFT